MFRVEVENSLEDAKALTALWDKRFKSAEITNYVYSENEVFLAQEIMGLKGLLEHLDTLNPVNFVKPDDIAFEIDNMIKRKVDDFEDPEVIYMIVSRKIKKILSYLNMQD
jgi:spore coat protein CotH